MLQIALVCLAVSCAAMWAQKTVRSTFRLQVHGKNVEVEERRISSTAAHPAAIIFLHGTGGPRSHNLPFLDEIDDLAKAGYSVYVPHYLDSTGVSTTDFHKSYPIWIETLEDTVSHLVKAGTPIETIALVGYSSGSSVALAAMARNPHFAAVIEFSGSLPDEYVPLVKTIPPLLILHGQKDDVIPVSNAQQLAKLCSLKGQTCVIKLYPAEGHSFTPPAVAASKRLMTQFLRDHLPLN